MYRIALAFLLAVAPVAQAADDPKGSLWSWNTERGTPPAASQDAEIDMASVDPHDVEFRGLFDRKGKPSDRARLLDGKPIEMIGFFTPPPGPDSPFLVFVGVPSVVCPYCERVSETDHLPYMLVYPTEKPRRYGYRERVRVRGLLYAKHDFDAMFGLHNDLRLDQAIIERDTLAVHPNRTRPLPELRMTGPVVTSENVD